MQLAGPGVFGPPKNHDAALAIFTAMQLRCRERGWDSNPRYGLLLMEFTRFL